MTRLIKLEPDSVELLYNLGTCLNELNLQNKAKDCYNKILTIDPNFVEAKWNLAFIQLMQGNYIDGWLNHETRKIREKTRKNYKNKFENKNWLGQKKLNNKTIYIIKEQGLG
jgi:tetratricopeptide (TPR) repeat protein